MIAAIKEKTDALVANIKTACQYAMESNPEEKETVLERHEIPKEEVAVHSKTAPSQEATKTEPDPGTMQSVEEHHEIPKEDAAVMLVGEPRK
jgi:diketogulonate reductase-like aldo/keto reductase